jgi:PTH1 family peptidyl-tRNA hydrolase
MGQPIDLIAGLGNPDPEYQVTRHNVGFWFADALASAHAASFSFEKKLEGAMTEVRVGGQRIRLLKPMTYMNESGRSISRALAYYKIPPERLLVVYDEIDLPPGRVKLKRGGGHAGHNGLRSVIEHIGADFWRIRIGVGHPGSRGRVVGHVLKRASTEEEDLILEGLGNALDALPLLLERGPQIAQNRLHSQKPADGDDGSLDADGDGSDDGLNER